jgi:hypothetical protein
MKDTKDPGNPFSIRLTQDEYDRLKDISGGKSVAGGVKELLRLYEEGSLVGDKGEDELSLLEHEIKGLKSSPFGFDKKEIALLERELDKAKEKYKKIKSESLKERILSLINSAG